MTLLRYGAHDAHVVERLDAVGSPLLDVALLHGGYWRAAYGRDLMDALAADLAARGMRAWNVEYRRTAGGDGGWPATFDDVRAALLLVAEVAGRAPVVVGHSAGGQLALWAGAEGLALGVVAQAPVADLVRGFELDLSDGAVALLLGGSPREVPGAYAMADPCARAPIGVPVLVQHGDADAHVPIEQSRSYAERDGGARLSIHHGVDHFAFLDPTSAVWLEAIAWITSTWLPPSSSTPPTR